MSNINLEQILSLDDVSILIAAHERIRHDMLLVADVFLDTYNSIIDRESGLGVLLFSFIAGAIVKEKGEFFLRMKYSVYRSSREFDLPISSLAGNIKQHVIQFAETVAHLENERIANVNTIMKEVLDMDGTQSNLEQYLSLRKKYESIPPEEGLRQSKQVPE